MEYSVADAPIDAMIWGHIADSKCPKDFSAYIEHAPERATHRDEAHERLIALADDDSQCQPDELSYLDAIAELKARRGCTLFDASVCGQATNENGERW
jgi:hypothetical protein